MTHEHTTKAKTLEGVVSSDKMKDTVVVVVERYVKHPKYQKFVQSRKKYKVHDEGNKAKVGDKVVIIGTRPISRHKSFRILEIKSAQQ
ncbi:MAG: 30S ribosomal protein S17 [Patescibacteria group bacterium]